MLRRIRSERRELNKEVAERSSQKAMLDNNVEAAEEASSDDDEDEDIGPEAADTLQLADNQTEEFDRLNNLLARNKNDIKARKIKMEPFLKDSSSAYLTDTEKRLIDIQIKSKRSVAELVSSYKNLSKEITKICNFQAVESYNDALSEVLYLANDMSCTYEAAKETERKLNDSTSLNTFVTHRSIQMRKLPFVTMCQFSKKLDKRVVA